LSQENVESTVKMTLDLNVDDTKDTNETNHNHNGNGVDECNGIASKKGRKRRRKQMEDLTNVNDESQTNGKNTNENHCDGDANENTGGGNIKRRRCAETLNELNLIREHRTDCPFVQVHQYLGQCMTGWEYCATIIAQNMPEFIEILTEKTT